MSTLAQNQTISNDKLRELRIDPEFRDKIPPLTEAEFNQLRENILKDGEVYEPICVWNGIIIDGHNRWRIIQENPKIPHRFREMDFIDKWAAFEWMYRNQLGRRNLTDEQRTYMIGKMYEARKKSQGGDRKSSLQNDDLEKGPAHTARLIADEVGVGRSTVERSEWFAKGVDTLRGESPEAADIVLKGKSGMTKAQVSQIRNMDKSSKTETARAIVRGAPIPKTAFGLPAKSKEINATINQSDAVARDADILPKYTVDDLCEEISVNAESYISVLKNTLAIRSTILDGDRPRIRNCVQKIIDDITKVRNLI